jgi:hypothetical protein
MSTIAMNNSRAMSSMISGVMRVASSRVRITTDLAG